MKLFLTGGTGFVGSEVLSQLLGAGHQVRVLARDPARLKTCPSLSGSGVEVCRGDILQPLADSIQGCEAVIHLVGIISEAGQLTFENVHARGTGNVLEASKRAGVKKFLHMSALGTRPNAVSRYHQTKWAAEQAVRESGLDFAIFRPSLIYGPRDQFVNLFAKIIRFSPIVPMIGSEQARFQPVPIMAVARSFVSSLADSQTRGKTYDLCGTEALTLRQILGQICQALDRKRLIVRIPSAIARIQATVLMLLYGVFGKPPPLNHDQLIMLEEGNTGDPHPAQERFNLPLPTFYDGISSYLGGE